MNNRQIADTFETIADLLQIKGEIIHRVMAYRNAADAIRELPRDINAIYADGQLQQIPNIGATLAEKIEELITTGELEFFNRLAAEVPVTLVDVLKVEGVGPKKAKKFWDELGITTLEQLQEAAAKGELQKLSGMGKKSEDRILAGIESLSRRTDRISIGIAMPLALDFLNELLKLPQVKKGHVAGSLRRFRETIGDLDLLVASDDPDPIMEAFIHHQSVERVLGHGPSKSSIETFQGPQVDLKVIPPERYGTALVYFTGSKQHNVRLREMAQNIGLTLNEHAFTNLETGEETLCATEEEVYAVLGLPYIPPEIREDRGELEAAQQNNLPDLIQLSDIKADLHMHTTWSDGSFSIREMAEAAKARGLSYIVITDHSQSLGIANGLTPERLLEQQAEVRKVDAEMGPDFRVFHGTEMDIRADGTLDFPDEVLEKLDVVIASIHVAQKQDKDQITQRALNAIRNPHVDIIGHPRGQLLPDREPTQLDMDAVFEAAAEHNTALEINANPRRLDLDAAYARRAQELGIKLVINTDAHHPENFELISYGIGTARRGWVEAQNVLNTWDADQFLDWIANR
ncbi:MAG: DNA polymerase/3'-5' exonuclease PolX [Chloroflexi bacterium]|nr:DNA polymerase/3'-5' exonuclease PolX [Chloroflexota bacterium]